MAMVSRLLSAAQPSCSNDLMGGAGGWSQKKTEEIPWPSQSPHNKSEARPLPSFESFFSNPAAPSCLPLPFFQLSGLGALPSLNTEGLQLLDGRQGLLFKTCGCMLRPSNLGAGISAMAIEVFLYSSFPALRSFLA